MPAYLTEHWMFYSLNNHGEFSGKLDGITGHPEVKDLSFAAFLVSIRLKKIKNI